MPKRPTRAELILALTQTCGALNQIASGQHSSPDERAKLKRIAADARDKGDAVLLNEIAHVTEKAAR